MTLFAAPEVPSKNVVAPALLEAFATYAKGLNNILDQGIGEHAWGGGVEVSYFP